MTKIVFSIQYAGLQLPVVKNDKGEDCTPLKPIADLFGLEWRRQQKKVTSEGYLSRYLGTCPVHMYRADGQKSEQTCIRIDRVAAYLMSISAEKVHAAGNVDSAKFLIEKQEEWADALHDYEELGQAINMNHARQQDQLRKLRMSLLQAVGVRNKTADAADRKVVGAVMEQMARELGIPFQPDLIE